jgi:hypothetical protein
MDGTKNFRKTTANAIFSSASDEGAGLLRARRRDFVANLLRCFAAETIARLGRLGLRLGVGRSALAARIRRRFVRRIRTRASLGAMLGARDVVLFAVMFGGGAMRHRRGFVKFGSLRITSLGHDFSPSSSLHRATRATIGFASPATAASETTQRRSKSFCFDRKHGIASTLLGSFRVCRLRHLFL